MSGSRHDWLDDETAERLLRGEPVDAGFAGTDEFGVEPAQKSRETRHSALAGLLSAARDADLPERTDGEDAALAAFLAARDLGTETALTARAAAERDEIARRAGTHTAGASGVPGARSGARRAIGRRRAGGTRDGWPGSLKVAMTAAFAATLLASGVTAAAVGVIPSMFSDPGPSPTPSGPHSTWPLPPQVPEPEGTQSSTPATGGPTPRIPAGQTPLPRLSGDGTDLPGWLDGGAQGVCRQYFFASGHGGVLRADERAWLDEQAGGAPAVDVYCERQLGPSGSPPGVLASPPALGDSVFRGGFYPSHCGPSAAPNQALPSGSASPSGSAGPSVSGSPHPSASLSPSPDPSGSATSPSPSASPSASVADGLPAPTAGPSSPVLSEPPSASAGPVAGSCDGRSGGDGADDGHHAAGHGHGSGGR